VRVRSVDIDILARTIYGEARSESMEGKIAVAHVVLNRLKAGKWFSGKTIAETCLLKSQFSCWLQGDPNRKIIDDVTMDDPHFQDSMYVAIGCIRGFLKDNTRGSSHYHTDTIKPFWTEDQIPVAHIGKHLFFRLDS
jgi:N-acetylmuramoyl-L-alanine amidase